MLLARSVAAGPNCVYVIPLWNVFPTRRLFTDTLERAGIVVASAAFRLLCAQGLLSHPRHTFEPRMRMGRAVCLSTHTPGFLPGCGLMCMHTFFLFVSNLRSFYFLVIHFLKCKETFQQIISTPDCPIWLCQFNFYVQMQQIFFRSFFKKKPLIFIKSD